MNSERFEIRRDLIEFESEEAECTGSGRFLQLWASRTIQKDGKPFEDIYCATFDEHSSEQDVIQVITSLALNYRDTDELRSLGYRDLARQLIRESRISDMEHNENP